MAIVLLYIFGSWLHFKPLRIRRFTLEYPRLSVVAQQLIVGPLELIGAAAIIYFTLACQRETPASLSFLAYSWFHFPRP